MRAQQPISCLRLRRYRAAHSACCTSLATDWSGCMRAGHCSSSKRVLLCSASQGRQTAATGMFAKSSACME